MVALRHPEDRIARRARARAYLRLIRIDAPERVREDALPDGMEYRDTGCELSASCLRCPLARCKHDERGGARKLSMAARDREIALLRRRYGAPLHMLAQTYGLSRRTIFRILREAGGGTREAGDDQRSDGPPVDAGGQA